MSEISSEFGLIENIKKMFGGIKSLCCEGIGDDCAVIPLSETRSLVVTTDMLVEDVHFICEGITPYLLGRKSLAVNISDVAAMGARPVASLLSVSFPRELPEVWVAEFIRGYHEISAEYGVALIGGDTTSSKGKITISVTAMGDVENKNIKRRSTSCVGDKVFVTGELGASNKGLVDVLKGDYNTCFALIHNNPRPHIEEGIWLGVQPSVHAMMDISDGVASDLVHILKASGVGAIIDVDRVPHVGDVAQALCGGEDYKLLLTASVDQADDLVESYFKHFGTVLFEIGSIVDDSPEIIWREAGQIITPDWKGYTHF